MKIPSKLKVGGITYEVKVVEEKELPDGAVGQIEVSDCIMKVSKGHPHFMNQTFLHEIFHAINMEIEEEKIEFFSQSLYQIIVDNPGLFTERKEGEKDGARTKGKTK